jgi:hypothetical protein
MRLVGNLFNTIFNWRTVKNVISASEEISSNFILRMSGLRHAPNPNSCSSSGTNQRRTSKDSRKHFWKDIIDHGRNL